MIIGPLKGIVNGVSEFVTTASKGVTYLAATDAEMVGLAPEGTAASIINKLEPHTGQIFGYDSYYQRVGGAAGEFDGPGALFKGIGLVSDGVSLLRRGGAGVPNIANDLAPNRIYSARELLRRVEEPGPYHNFPESFNSDIFAGKRTVISDQYVLYTKEGTITLPGEPIYGRAQVQIGEGQRVREIVGYTEPRVVDGTFEIGVKPSATGRTEVITHRFFRPKGS